MKNSVEIIKNVLPDSFNLKLCEYLANECSWSFAYEDISPYERIKNNEHLGFSFCTLNNYEFVKDPFLHRHAYIIYSFILQKLNLKGILMRAMWNLYLPNQCSSLHKDVISDNYISALYSLHETDGGIEIDGTFYEDKIGELKVFKSNTIHRGIGPKKNAARFNLNLVIELKK